MVFYLLPIGDWNCAYAVFIIDIRWGVRGVMQKKQSPVFRFPEVGISGLHTTKIVQTLSLL